MKGKKGQRGCLRSVSMLEVSEAVEIVHLGRVCGRREASENAETFPAALF